MIPEKLRRYFWDTDQTKIDLKENGRYLIERLLEVGDEDAFLWLKEKYNLAAIKEVLKTSRKLSRRSASF